MPGRIFKVTWAGRDENLGRLRCARPGDGPGLRPAPARRPPHRGRSGSSRTVWFCFDILKGRPYVPNVDMSSGERSETGRTKVRADGLQHVHLAGDLVGAFIEASQERGVVDDAPDAVTHFFKAGGFLGEGGTDEGLVVFAPEGSGTGDPLHFEVPGILGWQICSGKGVRTGSSVRWAGRRRARRGAVRR